MKIETRVITDPLMIGQIARIHAEARSEETDEYEYVDCGLFDEWRWGVIKLLVLRDREGKLWGTLVREQDGDHYYCNLDEDSEITFETVIAVPKTEYVLARLNKW